MTFLPRLLQTLVTVFIVSFCVFFLMGLMPGDPVDMMAAGNPKMTAQDVANLRALYGLDQPLFTRYGRWVLGALQGDLGYSRLFGVPVVDAILPKLAHTLLLTGLSLVLTVTLALPLGVYAAARKGGALDRVINLFCFSGISLPAFWSGLLLICLFSVALGWLPASASPSDLSSLILPVATLSIASLAVYVRHTRAGMIDALGLPHIKTAQAKGCTQTRVLWGHALRGVLPTLITLLMLDLGSIFGGALTVETVFAFPGMGKMMFDAVMGNDFNLALAAFLLLSCTVLLANLLADGFYKYLDPRMGAKEKADDA